MKEIYDIAIVGGGTAGMTAGIYGIRAGKKVLILEKKAYGGQILNTTKIENYPAAAHISGVEFSENLKNQAEELGVKFKLREVLKIEDLEGSFKVLTDEGEYCSRTVILANGSTERKLGLLNEEKLVGRGVSYCATCDGSLFKGKTVAVNGGGNTALWSALYLANVAKKVYLIHRREEFRADKALVKKVAGLSNVEFIMSSKIIKLVGEERLEGVIIERTDGEKNERKLEVAGLFIMIGRTPENEKFKALVELDEEGYIKVDEDLMTSREGVFAAGDVRKKKLNQLVTATADGAVAATSAIQYLNKGGKNV